MYLSRYHTLGICRVVLEWLTIPHRASVSVYTTCKTNAIKACGVGVPACLVDQHEFVPLHNSAPHCMNYIPLGICLNKHKLMY